MSRLPEARPHSMRCLLGGPSFTISTDLPSFPPKDRPTAGKEDPPPNSEQCKADSLSLSEICPFKDFPSPGGTESI